MKRNDESGKERKFVYLIRATNGLVKIGITSDIEHRFRTLNAGSPLELKLLGCIESGNVQELEKELHTRFSDKNVRHEWFNLSFEDVSYIKGNHNFIETEIVYKVFLKGHAKVVFDLP